MANSDKLKFNKKEILFFIIPFLILSFLIGIMGHSTAINRVADINAIVRNSTIDIADSYAHMIANSNEINRVVDNLMEEKLLLVGEAILLLGEEKIESDELVEIARRFNVWRINLYNDEGQVIGSNAVGNIGWRSYDGHPVQEFLESNKKTHIEEIREGTINNDFVKFGYIKRENGSFVQVGIVEEDLQKFTKDFQAKVLIDSIQEREDVIHAFLVNMDFKIIASSTDDMVGTEVNAEGIRKHLHDTSVGLEKHTVNGSSALHAYAPIFNGEKRTGMLSIIWDTKLTDIAIRQILINTIKELFITITIIGSILYYAYRKNKSNIRIAYYDKLTGLPNKDYLEEYMGQFTREVGNINKAVFFINLTNFKLINMTYGYNYGDQILVQVSKGIKNKLKKNHMLFRFNADRFVLLIEGYKNKHELKNIAQEIIKTSKQPLGQEHRLEYLNIEIAIVEVNEKNSSLDKLSKNMSFALSNTGPLNREIVFYSEEVETRGIRENKIELALEGVIERKRGDIFFLEFQPKFDLRLNKITGFEALARLRHKDLGFIPPLEFIELAEKRMLIYDLGNIVFRKACEFLKELEKQGHDDISISVNVSGIQMLRDEFVEDLKTITKDLDVNRSLIELEITETILIENFDLINKKLREIKSLGMSVSIDDFGTGFSSFARLQKLHIDIVKIDKFFIDSILLEDENSLISKDIISMAHRLGLTVVAEGVEEEKQRQYLQKYNCDIIQGYLISKPISEGAAIELLESYE